MLGTTALGDADLIVTLLAEHAGRVRGVARSARKSRARFGGALEPMTRVRATWTEPAGEGMRRLESLELQRSYADMQAEPMVQAVCGLLAETGMAAVREDQEEPATYRLYGAVLDALAAGLDPWCAVRYFEYWMLRLHGVLAEWNACVFCGKGLSAAGGLTAIPAEGPACPSCAGQRHGGIRLGPRDREALRSLDRLPPARTGDLSDRCAASSPLGRFLRASLEGFLERRPRSYRHMEALP